MSDTLDLAPPQRAPVLRANPSGRSVGDGVEQSFSAVLFPFEEGAEQSLYGFPPPFVFEGAQQSFVAPVMPFEDASEK